MPQHTVMPNPSNPFGMPGQQLINAPGPKPFSTFLTSPDQQNFLQPQATGVNPFRQSMLLPQTTGMALFGVGNSPGMSMGAPQQPSNPFPVSNQPSQPMTPGFGQSLFNVTSQPQQPQQHQIQQPFQSLPASASVLPSGSALSSATQTQSNLNVPQRPASTPLTSFGSAIKSISPPPLKPHMTGTKNPFGPIITPAPPVPKPPTMAELAMGRTGAGSAPVGSTEPQQPAQVNGAAPSYTSGFNFGNSALNPGGTDMGSVASSFAFSSAKPAGAVATSPTGISAASGSSFSDSLFGGSSISGLSSQPTSANTTSGNAIAATASLPTGVGNGTNPTAAPLKPQMTGFAGLKPFKPTSSFGAALIESLPPVPNSSSAAGATSPAYSTAGATTIGSATGGSGSSSFGTSEFGALNKQQPTGFGGSLGGSGAMHAANGHAGSATLTNSFSPTGNVTPSAASRLGVGLRPQITGGGAANPFRASMAAGNTLGGGGIPSVPPLPTGFGSGSMFGTMPSFSSSAPFNGAFGQPQQGAGQQPQGQQQGQGSLI